MSINIHLRSNVLTLENIYRKKLELNIRNHCSKGTLVASFLIIKYHQSPVLIRYELETVGQESRS